MSYTTEELKGMIGKRFYWDDISNRYVIERTGVLDDVYRRQLSFDGRQDYRRISDYKNLRTESDYKDLP